MSDEEKKIPLPEIPVKIPPLSRRRAGAIETKIFTDKNLIFVQQDMTAMWGFARSMAYMAFAYTEMSAILPKILQQYRAGDMDEDRDHKYCEYLNHFVRYTEYLGSCACVMLPHKLMEQIHNPKAREEFSHEIILNVLKELSKQDGDFKFPRFEDEDDQS